MKKISQFLLKLFKTETAKDTILVMIANAVNGITGIIFTILVAKYLSVAEFGIFSSATNLTLILASLVDLGMTQGVVNFLPGLLANKKEVKVKNHVATMILTVIMVSLIVLVMTLFLPGSIAIKIAGTNNRLHLLFIGLGVFGMALFLFFLGLFQAYKNFTAFMLIEVIMAIARVGFIGMMVLVGLSVAKALGSLLIGVVASFLLVYFYWPIGKLRLNFSIKTFAKIFSFSRWLWLVNMIINVYGKLDILLLTMLTSSIVVGQYSAAARLSLVFPLVVNSLNAVIAPRFAGFFEKKTMLIYSLKTLLLSIALILGLAVFIVLAKPMILLIYGERYQVAIKLFQGLIIANLPLILTIPATNGLVYFFKKPSLVTFVSGFQLLLFGMITWFLVPKVSAFAPIWGFFAANLLGLTLMYLFWLKLYLTKK